MPSARELLQQVGALMHRNAQKADPGVPELTDVVIEPVLSIPLRPIALEDIPELTDMVEEIEIASVAELHDDDGDPSIWPGLDRGDPSVAGLPPSGVTVVPLVARSARRRGEPAPQSDGAATDSPVPPEVLPAAAPAQEALAQEALAQEAPAPEPAPSVQDDSARWDALAEEVRIQVLQRLDIFTESRLRERLTAHLRPIVDRAGEELVATINAELGKLIRSHVAETIEREIEKWRKET